MVMLANSQDRKLIEKDKVESLERNSALKPLVLKSNEETQKEIFPLLN